MPRRFTGKLFWRCFTDQLSTQMGSRIVSNDFLILASTDFQQLWKVAFHYQSSIMWPPPAGPAGGHLCTVRSTDRTFLGACWQFSTKTLTQRSSRRCWSILRGCWACRCKDGWDVGRLQAAGRRVSQREDVTGLPAAILARAAAAASSSCPSHSSCRHASLQLSCPVLG